MFLRCFEDIPHRKLITARVLFTFFAVSTFVFFIISIPTYDQATKVVEIPGWDVNTSRAVYEYIYPNNLTLILSPSDLICDDIENDNNTLELLVVVCSAIENFSQRHAIRKTWANEYQTHTNVARVVFLLGTTQNASIQDVVVRENALHDDIIQENFYDTYNNLTLKTIMMLKWVTTRCNVKYVMKTDDDMFINIPNLVQSLRVDYPTHTNVLVGCLICHAKPIDDVTSKWYAPKYLYGADRYPNYLSGTGYVMSMDVARKLYDVALNTPIFHLEDVYLTGIVAAKTGITPVNHRGFTYKQMDCKNLCKCKALISIHHKRPRDLQMMYFNMLKNPLTHCRNSTRKRTSRKRQGDCS